MIDYEKLKTAHELAYKLSQKIEGCLDITVSFNNSEYHKSLDYLLKDHKRNEEWLFSTLDDLIMELNERTKPEPKYKDAWFVNAHGRAQCTEVLNKEGYICCDKSDIQALSRTMYPTKESLIAAQIAHWNSLSEPAECQHEPNGQTSFIGYPEAYKCKKCMVYYR